MDLETSILARYRGEARLQRLLWVANHTTDANLARQAIQHALQQAMDQNNVQRYKEIYHHYGGGDKFLTAETSVLPPFQGAWLQDTERKLAQSREVLSSRLATAQAHLNKDAIRTAYLALAEHDHQAGDLVEAFHAVLRAKDFCTSRVQTAKVSLLILQLALAMKNYSTVHDYVTKIDITLGATGTTSGSTSESSTLESIRHKVMTAAALERLAAGDYKAAAQKFRLAACSGQLMSSSSGGSDQTDEGSPGAGAGRGWDHVLAPEEISLYAALLCLAVPNTRSEIVALAEHPEALELVPAVREALLQFARRANYQMAWSILEESVFPAIQLDLYMSSHLSILQQKIREKSIQQYWQAFERVPLSVMAGQLGPGVAPPENLLNIIVDLMGRNELAKDTRIDLQAHMLVRQTPQLSADQERVGQTCDKLSQLSHRVLNDAYAMIVHLACVEHGLMVGDQFAGHRRRGRGRPRSLGPVPAGPGPGSASSMGEVLEDTEDDADAPMVDVGEGMNPEDLY